MQQLNFPDLLDRHLGSHYLHRGLSNGWLATVWLAFLLSQSNHRKVSVQDWARNHPHTLETLIGQALRPIEFADDRLSIVLRRLHDADWSALEADLWQATCEVYEISYQCVRLDSTTSFGYHTIIHLSIPNELVGEVRRFLQALKDREMFSRLEILEFEWVRIAPMKSEFYDFDTGRWDFEWQNSARKDYQAAAFLPSSTASSTT